MTSQQLADELLRQWQLLWALEPAERIKRIDQIKLDYEFEQQMQLVDREMTLEPVGT